MRAPKRHVALLGMMGAGKSTVGRRLARELGLHFVDTDDLVRAVAARSISDIFAAEGEAGFRERELSAVREAFAGPAAVVALGGGSVTHRPTRELVARDAVRVYLEIDVHTAYARLRKSRTVRPLLGDDPTLERIANMLAEREAFYREAEVTVRGSRRGVAVLAREIVAQLAERAALREARAG